METVEQMWARIDAYKKTKYDKIVSTKVESSTDAYNFIELLTEMICLYIDPFMDEDEKWEDVFEKHIFCDNFAHNDVFGRYNEQAEEVIIKKLKICDSLIGRKTVAMTFYNFRQKQESKRPVVHFLSGDEEPRECNRQFRSMMDDEDAWGNID